jgi:hypothetical protein
LGVHLGLALVARQEAAAQLGQQRRPQAPQEMYGQSRWCRRDQRHGDAPLITFPLIGVAFLEGDALWREPLKLGWGVSDVIANGGAYSTDAGQLDAATGKP